MNVKKTAINPYLQAHFPLIISLLEEHKIKDAYLFGSAITDRFDEKKSDVDLLVNFIDGLDPLEKGELLWSLRFSLEDKLNRPVDLITETSLKNPYLIEEVNEKKMKIYG
jgi:predicted nucleotidyltransferase